ncbi:hypothetical protein KP509_12G003100 [Ceratopteris richardii]|uniref:dual-specificity kinase n=1 Tax=Ceratopteris richardii TaxID=49495 RepID=A0A8T2TLP5_CERRI|nr:hypothetical protein KP509_12G003100 [Ceratopteris richardii]KAH7422313.1 hypothetical protein KP509_12G003100 [Ceratopteris richardii]KAH7422314.1 hypothetical protein KP509_12G003100 [Ceratopteris richardii]
MARKELLESRKNLLPCGHHEHQNKMICNICNNRQQQPTRKPSLPHKGLSTSPSKIPSLKKINEIKRTSTRALNLPALNLDKVRRNYFEQAELASYSATRGYVPDPPKVNSARYSADKNKSDRRSFVSGSLTERGTRELLPERRVATSGTLTDRSCRQSCERKSVTSGSLTDRSCRDSFGSSYGLSLSNYLRHSRDSPLRNSKEGPFTAPTMPRIKLDDRLNGNRLTSESRKSRGDKSAKYHSSVSLSTYLPLTAPHTSISCRSSHVDTIGGISRHSNLVSRTLLGSRDGSDSKHNSDSRVVQTGNGGDSTRNSITKAESSSWDARRLPTQLVNTLEEALQGVSHKDASPAEAKKTPNNHSSAAKDLSVAKASGKLSVIRPSGQMDKVKARDVRRSQEDLSSDELATSRRACQKLLEGETTTSGKEMISKLQSKSFKISPLKLPLGSTQSTVPLGFGGNPRENVQTSRTLQALENEANLRLALTERGVFRKASLASSSPRRERNNFSAVLSHASGVSMTPEMALKQFGSLLTEYEHHEIKGYTDIYCVGAECQKLQPSSTPGACNYGFDDERGDYIINERDHIAYRFEILGLLGKGSFGQVVKCQDHKYKVLRAIKLVRNKKRFHQQALIEVKILQHLREKAEEEATSHNVVTIHESFYFRGHLCISFSLHDISLYELIKRNNFQGISLVVIKSFATQLLATLKFLRKLRVIHCDLKPENILLQHPSMSKIKVIDFGSSCFDHEKIYTYIQSRFYRSPEVILGIPYDTMIDIWSFGCILAELYTGYPLFPGENEVEQLSCMMEVLGVPPRHVLEQATRKKMFFDSNSNPRIVPNSWGKKHWPGTKDLATAISCNDMLFVDFLECCLRWDKSQRAAPDELLQHPWIVGESPIVRTPFRPSNQDISKRRQISLPSNVSCKFSIY